MCGKSAFGLWSWLDVCCPGQWPPGCRVDTDKGRRGGTSQSPDTRPAAGDGHLHDQASKQARHHACGEPPPARCTHSEHGPLPQSTATAQSRCLLAVPKMPPPNPSRLFLFDGVEAGDPPVSSAIPLQLGRRSSQGLVVGHGNPVRLRLLPCLAWSSRRWPRLHG